MKAILTAPALLFLSACGTIGLEYYTQDTGAALGLDDTPPYGGDTQIGDDTAADTQDTDDTDDTQDTDDPPPDEDHRPELSITSASDAATELTVSFNLFDEDADMTGGSLSVTVSGETTNYDVPGQLDSWNHGGTSSLTIDIDPCTMGASPNISIQATDTTGLTSIPASHTHSLTTPELLIDTSRADDFSDTYVNIGSSGVYLGTLSRPSVLCGNLYEATNNGTAFTGDVDFLDFTTGFGGSTTFTLTWEQTGDYDLYLYNGNNGNGLASAYTNGNTQPESFSYTLSSGQPYILMTAGWSGNGGDWRLVIE